MIEINHHIPVMLEEIKNNIPKTKKLNIIDATFGGGGYSKEILKTFNVNYLIGIDRDPISKEFAKKIRNKFKNFEFINGCFSKIDELVQRNKKLKDNLFDIIIFDLGVSSNQVDNPSRGFSFTKNGPLNMSMGSSKIIASDVVNNYSEKKLADIFYNFGEERFAKKIARNIVISRKDKLFENTLELSNLINKSIPTVYSKKRRINPATKTFQALRIYVNDELNELKVGLKKSIKLLTKQGKIFVVSFQSLEDRIVKDFFNHNSGKRWRSSRHYPELSDTGPITFKIITKKPIRPNEQEINFNPRSRSAKLRIAQKLN